MDNAGKSNSDLADLAKRTLVVVAVIGIVALAIILRQLVLALFAAVLVAIFLFKSAELVGRKTHLGYRAGLALTCLTILVIAGVTVAFFWPFFQSQIPQLLEGVTEALDTLQDQLGITLPDNAQEMAGNLAGLASQVWGFLMSAVGALATAVSGFVLVAVAAIFFASDPKRYLDGVVGMLPPAARDSTRRALANLSDDLSNWMRAQLLGMILVGVLTGVGAWAIGLPQPLALGLFAGLGEMVPYVGPFVAALPALLVAFSEGGDLIWWTIGLYVIVQQAEGNLIMPLLQDRIADVPPVVMLFSLVAFGLLFGIVGIILAAPLTVAAHSLAKAFGAARAEAEPERESIAA